MLIDTHCHVNMMIKKEFDKIATPQEIISAEKIIVDAKKNDVTTIINVGTSVPESINCVALAATYPNCYAVVGIHPNDCTSEWKKDIALLTPYIKQKEKNKIIGIGECGLDMHYPEYNLQRQQDAFRAQIELALAHDLALIIHSRDAYDETLKILDEYKNDLQRNNCARTIMHCFSYDALFAQTVIAWNMHLGIGGTITYPKNKELRSLVQSLPLEHIVLETDAPFLPPQSMRGKQNHPLHIKDIASFIADLKDMPLDAVVHQIQKNCDDIFMIKAQQQ